MGFKELAPKVAQGFKDFFGSKIRLALVAAFVVTVVVFVIWVSV